MQDDVTDGVKALIDQHLADPHHVCILGGSYGGYAALAGAAFTPDLYSCAISINGVFDLPLIRHTKKSTRAGSQTPRCIGVSTSARPSIPRSWQPHRTAIRFT